MRKRRILSFNHLLILLIVLISGCNEEKAEAIKVSAEKFRIEATSALEKINYLMSQSVSTPSESNQTKLDNIVELLIAEETINSEKLSELIAAEDINVGALTIIDEGLQKIERSYYQFESMFRSLPRGSYFAKNAVAKAEKFAINLTMEMINFANFIHSKYPVQFTGRRISILEKINAAKSETNPELKKKYMKLIAEDIMLLRLDERKAKEDAILQCLKAAEAGKLVANLIRDYGKLNANDLLNSVSTSFGFISEISNQNQDVENLIKKFDSLATTIREDPYWNTLLDEPIIQ